MFITIRNGFWSFNRLDVDPHRQPYLRHERWLIAAPRLTEREIHMTWLKRMETDVEVAVTRWFLSASSPGPAAFANPWSPGTGSWRFAERAGGVTEPPFIPFDLKTVAARVPGASPVERPRREWRRPVVLTELAQPIDRAYHLGGRAAWRSSR